MDEFLNAGEVVAVGMKSSAAVVEKCGIVGEYNVVCYDENGIIVWEHHIDNVVVTVGKNAILTDALAGSSYSVTGPFMLLISSASFSAISAADTMSSHAGWLEGGGTNAPTYTGTRPTVAFNAASAGAMTSSGTISFAITGTGTIQGIAMTFGSGAVSTKDNTSGTLLSAGTLAAAQPVINGNTVVATYTLSL